MDDDTNHAIRTLTSHCTVLDARVAALTALAAALLKDHPQRDLIQTRWSEYLGPALHEAGPGLGQSEIEVAADVPAWVSLQVDKIPGTL